MLLQARYSSSIGTKVLEHEDEGPPSGSESDCLEDKYCDLVEKRQKEMQKDGGMTMDEMMKMIAGSADPQDPAHEGQPDEPKGTSKRGKGHAPRDTPTKAKKRRMDETLEEASDDGELGVAGGSKLTSRNTPNRRQAYKGTTTGSSGSRPSVTGHAGKQPPNNPSPDKHGAARGRRKIGVSEHADREMASFLAAGPDSHYFGEQWPNMKRCLRRYIEQAQVEVKKMADEDKEEACLSMRKLQYIECCGKIYSAWKGRQDLKADADDFNLKWNSLCSFCEETPKVKMESPQMWKLYIEVQCLAPSSATFVDDLFFSTFSARFPDMPREDVMKEQLHYLRMMITGILDSSSSFEVAQGQLTSRLEPFTESPRVLLEKELSKELVQDIHDCFVLAFAQKRICYTSDRMSLVAIVQKLKNQDEQVGELLRTFRVYKKLGSQFINNAAAAVSSQHESCKIYKELSDNVRCLSSRETVKFEDILRIGEWIESLPGDIASWLKSHPCEDEPKFENLQAFMSVVSEEQVATCVASWAAQFSSSEVEKITGTKPEEIQWVRALLELPTVKKDKTSASAVESVLQWYNSTALVAKTRTDVASLTREECLELVKLRDTSALHTWRKRHAEQKPNSNFLAALSRLPQARA